MNRLHLRASEVEMPGAHERDGRRVTNSVLVAAEFGGAHDEVLRVIRELDYPEEIREQDFRWVACADGRGRERPMVEIAVHGFLALCRALRGARAEGWMQRLLLMDAIAATEASLREGPALDPEMLGVESIHDLLAILFAGALSGGLGLDPPAIAREHVSAAYLIYGEGPPLGFCFALCEDVTHALMAHCAETGAQPVLCPRTGAWLFPIDVAENWRRISGSRLIAEHRAAWEASRRALLEHLEHAEPTWFPA